jgi:hypothetical protein
MAHALASDVDLDFGDVSVGLGKTLLFLSAILGLRADKRKAPTGPGLKSKVTPRRSPARRFQRRVGELTMRAFGAPVNSRVPLIRASP